MAKFLHIYQDICNYRTPKKTNTGVLVPGGTAYAIKLNFGHDERNGINGHREHTSEIR